MALPTVALINSAVNDLYAAFADRKTRAGTRKGVSDLNAVLQNIVKMYDADVSLTVTDATDADDAAFMLVGGELGIALGREAIAGDIFEVLGTGDTTDNALQTAKGSAPAANDRFQALTNATFKFLGASATFDFSDEDVTDFISIGA